MSTNMGNFYVTKYNLENKLTFSVDPSPLGFQCQNYHEITFIQDTYFAQ